MSTNLSMLNFAQALLTKDTDYLILNKNEIYKEIDDSTIAKISRAIAEWRDEDYLNSDPKLIFSQITCGVVLAGLALGSVIELIMNLFLAIVLSPLEVIGALCDVDYC